MPLITVTGYPCSGKSTIAENLAKILQAEPYACQVRLVTDTEFGFNPAVTPLGKLDSV